MFDQCCFCYCWRLFLSFENAAFLHQTEVSADDESNHHCQSHSVQMNWAQPHESTGRLIYTVESVQCPASRFLFSLFLFSLSLSVYTPVSFPAKTHINHWSMQLIFPPTCQEKEWERHRPHPGSVYLCYYRRVNCEAFLFSSVFTEITMHSAERLRMAMFALERNGSSWERGKKKRSPFNVFEALEIDERYVIDFASCGLLFLCADNYERISQSKQ